MRNGSFIVFEGINGSGKTVQMHRFISRLYDSDKSRTLFVTREPNEFGDFGKMAREMLRTDKDPYANKLRAVEYFAENRREHNKIFSPLLDKGIDVLCDRYYHSTFAFQHAQGILNEEIAARNKNVKMPDLTYFIDVSVEEADKRLRLRDSQRRKFDLNIDFLNKVRENYLKLPGILPSLIGDKSIVVIDGHLSLEEVAEKIWDVYSEKF